MLAEPYLIDLISKALTDAGLLCFVRWFCAVLCCVMLCRALPEDELIGLISKQLVDAGLLSKADTPFAAAMSGLMKGSVDVLTQATQQLPPLLGYPLSETAASEEFKPVGGVGSVAVGGKGALALALCLGAELGLRGNMSWERHIEGLALLLWVSLGGRLGGYQQQGCQVVCPVVQKSSNNC